MSWGSTAPAAMTAIGTACQAAITDAKVEAPGLVVTDETFAAVITIGYQDEDTRAVEGTFVPEGYAALPDREAYRINNLISAHNGDGDFAAAQTQAFTVLGEVGGVLAANQRIGATLKAHLGDWNLTLLATTDQGAIAELRFAIDVDAFTTT
jgi:hypothetical protein